MLRAILIVALCHKSKFQAPALPKWPIAAMWLSGPARRLKNALRASSDQAKQAL